MAFSFYCNDFGWGAGFFAWAPRNQNIELVK